MHKYEISITDVRSASFLEEYTDIETARDAAIRKALDRMLDAPGVRNPQKATCNVVERDTLEERTFEVALSIVDLI